MFLLLWMYFLKYRHAVYLLIFWLSQQFIYDRWFLFLMRNSCWKILLFNFDKIFFFYRLSFLFLRQIKRFTQLKAQKHVQLSQRRITFISPNTASQMWQQIIFPFFTVFDPRSPSTHLLMTCKILLGENTHSCRRFTRVGIINFDICALKVDL